MTDYPGYVERAVLAEERAEQASLPDIADGWHKLADNYRALAHQRDQMDRDRTGAAQC